MRGEPRNAKPMLSLHSPFFFKELSLIVCASLSVLAMQYSIFCTFVEIERLNIALRTELNEFEMYFNLSTTFLNQALSQGARIRRAAVKKLFATSDSGYGASSYAMSNGVPGFDGYPGVDGLQLYMDQDISCILCPRGPPGLPGPPGAEGFRGLQGAHGAPGLVSYASYAYPAPGAQGPPGDRGRSGRDGYPGPSGSRGSPGITYLKGAGGRAGSPGPRGPSGRAGASPPRADRGPPGAHGVPGIEGRRGRQGVNGLEGNPGDRGRKGHDGEYCPCPNRPPPDHHYTTSTPHRPIPLTRYITLPPAVPWEEEEYKVRTVNSRSAEATLPQPPAMQPQSYISIDGAALAPPNEWVEDISFAGPPLPENWESKEWSRLTQRRNKRWQEFLQAPTFYLGPPTLPKGLQIDNVNKTYKTVRKRVTTAPRRRLLIEDYDKASSNREVTLNKRIELNPWASLRLGAARGSVQPGAGGEYA